MPLKPEKPTRTQPARAVKTPPVVVIDGRVKKTPTSPKKPKSPKGTAKNPNKSKEGEPLEGTDAETDIEKRFPLKGRHNFLKESEIVVGNIIGAGYHEAWSPQQNQGTEYKLDYVRTSGNDCGYVHSKYRKFVIVARYTRHFVALPIYTHRFRSMEMFGGYNEYAEILDSTVKGATLPRPRPLCRGDNSNIWLWSKACSAILDHKWARMDNSSVAWMARPVAFQNKIRAQVVSKLETDSEEQLLRWSRDCLLEGLEEEVREHLRVLRRDKIKAPEVEGPGPWGK